MFIKKYIVISSVMAAICGSPTAFAYDDDMPGDWCGTGYPIMGLPIVLTPGPVWVWVVKPKGNEGVSPFRSFDLGSLPVGRNPMAPSMRGDHGTSLLFTMGKTSYRSLMDNPIRSSASDDRSSLDLKSLRTSSRLLHWKDVDMGGPKNVSDVMSLSTNN